MILGYRFKGMGGNGKLPEGEIRGNLGMTLGGEREPRLSVGEEAGGWEAIRGRCVSIFRLHILSSLTERWNISDSACLRCLETLT
jgi:hypothetical protein